MNDAMPGVLVNGQRVELDYRLQAGDEIAICPTGSRNRAEVFDDGRPWPEILTPEETARALRLDVIHKGDMAKALRALTRLTDDRRLIRATTYAGRGGGQRMYPIDEVRAFIRSRSSCEV